ncbi:MAG: hypothetical protein JWN86_1993 [Planctomycetota bacterium]|nr:hypothetical protein [Planctomycetota bacterium]
MPSEITLPKAGKPPGVAGAWDRFFFTPADPAPLGLIRIATGLLLMWSLGCMAFDLRGFLGEAGWVDQDILREARHDHWEWSLWNLVPDGMLWPAWSGMMVVLALFTVGFQSRVVAPLAWAVAVSTARRNPLILFGFDQFVSLWAFYLAVTGASGQAFSLDQLLSRRRLGPCGVQPTISANLALRLIQLHLAVSYGAAGVAKLGGVSWREGSAIIKILGNGEFRPFDLTWILTLPGAEYGLNLAAHLAVWTEVLYPVLIWKPRVRPWLLWAVLAMHAGIAITLGLTEFSLAMLTGNLAFLSGEQIRRWMRRRRHGLGQDVAVESQEEIPVAPPAARPPRPSGRPRR